MIATTSSHSRHRFSASNRAVEALPAIEGLLEEAGFRIISFQKAEDFLRDARFDGPCCIILDVSLPGISGLDFQQQLRKAVVRTPIIFLTAHGDIPMTVTALNQEQSNSSPSLLMSNYDRSADGMPR
jgi:DNA-binding NtrC family response regulator